MDGQENGWKYTPEVNEDTPQVLGDAKKETNQVKGLNWIALTGSEERKKFAWYLMLFLVTIIIAAIILITTHDKISTAVIIVCGLIVGFYGSKKPKEISYSIDETGFTINKKQYSFNGFKSFSVISSDNQITVALTPLKRFMPYSYLSFKKDIADKVTSLLANKLPMEKAKYDPLERLFRFIGF